MRKILSAVLAVVLLVTLMVPCAMAAEAGTEPASTEKSSMNANGGGFTDKLLSAERPETEAGESSAVANVVVFAGLVVVVGISVAMVIDKKRKLYK